MSELPFHDGSAVLVVDSAGRVLLQQRDDDLAPAGYGRWAIPGGHRERDETPLQTVVREFEEETGYRLQRARFYTVATPERYHGLPSANLHVFIADDPVDEEALVVTEGLAFRFFAPAELPGLLMNPGPRALIADFLATDLYRGTVAFLAARKTGVAVLELDRWGRVLLQLRDADLPPERHPDSWSLPGGLLEPGEPPDACGLREFEEETGVLLNTLRFFRTYRRDADLPSLRVDVQHVYFIDADVEEDAIDVREGQAFRYFREDELTGLAVPAHARTILADFFASPAYRGLFH